MSHGLIIRRQTGGTAVTDPFLDGYHQRCSGLIQSGASLNLRADTLSNLTVVTGAGLSVRGR